MSSTARQEIDQGLLRPAPVIAVGFGKKRAVSSISGFDQLDRGIAQQLGLSLGQYANKWVIVGMNDQGGNSNFLEYAGRAGASVIIIRAVETFIARGDLVVELADAGKVFEVREIVAVWK